MNTRQKIGRRFLPLPKDGDLMNIPFHFNSRVTLPAVGMNNAPRLNGLSHKGMQTLRRGIRNPFHPNSPDSPSNLFCSNHYQRLFLHLPPTDTLFQAAQIGFVHLDLTRKSVTSRSYHSPSQLMEPSPCSLIAAQSKNSLQSQRTGTIFLTGYPPYRSKPHSQWLMGVLKDSPSYHRCPVTAFSTLEESSPYWPSFLVAATWATEAFRPTQLKKIVSARFFRRKSSFKFHKSSGVVFHAPILHIGATSVKWIPPLLNMSASHAW